MKPFKIRTHVNVKELDYDSFCGLVFNYKDGGNFYTFAFNGEEVKFIRYENNCMVGAISQGVKWQKNKKLDMEWELVSEGNVLSFFVDGMPILKVRYMPLTYSGVGFYCFGEQTLTVDDIEYIEM